MIGSRSKITPKSDGAQRIWFLRMGWMLGLWVFAGGQVLGGSVMIGPDDTKVSLGKHLQYLEDPTEKMTIEDFLKATKNESALTKSEVDTPSFGYTSSAYWFTVDLENTGQQRRNLLLEINYPLLDQISIYKISGEKILDHAELGDLKPFNSRPIAHRNFLYPLKIENI